MEPFPFPQILKQLINNGSAARCDRHFDQCGVGINGPHHSHAVVRFKGIPQVTDILAVYLEHSSVGFHSYAPPPHINFVLRILKKL